MIYFRGIKMNTKPITVYPAKHVTVLALTATLLTGCQTTDMGNKEGLGTILGSIGGAVLGSQFGSGTGKILAQAGGAALGGYLGNMLGKMLDEQDQAAVKAEANSAFNSASDGETVSWKNPESGASASMKVNGTESSSRTIKIARIKEISAPQNISLIGKTYQSTSSSNIRSGPSASSVKVGGLASGERFQAVGSVSDGEWIVVGHNNVSVGYVHSSLVREAKEINLADSDSAVDLDSIPVTDRQQALRDPINLDDMNTDDNMVVETISASTECRTMDMNVSSKDGESANETLKACKSTDGAWEII